MVHSRSRTSSLWVYSSFRTYYCEPRSSLLKKNQQFSGLSLTDLSMLQFIVTADASMSWFNVIAGAMLLHVSSTNAWPVSGERRWSDEVCLQLALQGFPWRYNHTTWPHIYSHRPFGHAVIFCSPRTRCVPRVPLSYSDLLSSACPLMRLPVLNYYPRHVVSPRWVGRSILCSTARPSLRLQYECAHVWPEKDRPP